MKKFGLSLIILAAVLLTAAFTPPVQAQKLASEGTVLDVIQVTNDTSSNGITKQVLIPDIKNYKKFTFMTGSIGNDSTSYEFTLLGGTGNMWIQLWKDTITNKTCQTGAISGTDTSAARIFTYDMTDSTVLITELLWIRKNLSSGNGTGPASNRTRANDFLIGWKPEIWKP
jgi:hypothetical protein